MSIYPQSAKGIDLRAAHVTVTESTLQPSGGLARGRDIIVLAGFFNGDTTLYEYTPVSSVDQITRHCCTDLSDYEAIDEFKYSSMWKALISCRINGGTDVVFFKLGTLDEWNAIEEENEQMNLLYERLTAAYDLLADNEWFSYVVPVDAPAEGYTREAYIEYDPILDEAGDPVLDLNGDPTFTEIPHEEMFLDFMQLMAFACTTAMSRGIFLQTMLSTASSNGTVLLNNESMRVKETWQYTNCRDQQGRVVPGADAYRFVAVPTGKALFSTSEYNTSFQFGMAPAIAGLSSSLPDDVSLAGRKIRVSSIISPPLGSMADELSMAGYMPIGESAAMRRRKEQAGLILGDNTMGIPVSDFKQEVVLRLARRVSTKLRIALDPLIGTNGSRIGSAVENTMNDLVTAGTIRGYTYKIAKDPTDQYRLQLYVEIVPYLPVKAIEISIVTGPFV